MVRVDILFYVDQLLSNSYFEAASRLASLIDSADNACTGTIPTKFTKLCPTVPPQN